MGYFALQKRFIIRKAFRDRRIVLDTNEYERLVTLYLDCIYRIALNGCHNYMDAEDVVQCNLTEYLTKRTFQRETIREEVGNDGKPREIKGFGEFHREKMKHL